MRIEDCEVGMEVEPLKEFGEIHRDGLKIYSINKERGTISIRNGCFVSADHNPEYFRPTSKFKIGNEAIVKFLNDSKVKVWGKKYNKTMNEYLYAVQGCGWNDFCRESELSPLKKPDELEVGDKFIDLLEGKYKVIAVDYDDCFDHVSYFAKKIDCDLKGRITIKKPSTVKEIIYD